MLEDSNTATYVYGHPHIGTTPMSLEIHELNMSPSTDLRADACVRATICTRACWFAATIDAEPLPVSVLHLLGTVLARITQQIESFTERRQLELALQLLTRATQCLPPKARRSVDEEMERWEAAKQPAALARWATRVVSGTGTEYDGEYVAVTRTHDSVIEYRAEAAADGRRGGKPQNLALYRDATDHSWVLGVVRDEAPGATRPEARFCALHSTGADEPPETGWTPASQVCCARVQLFRRPKLAFWINLKLFVCK